MKIIFETGDVFTISLDDSSQGLGQVLAKYRDTDLFYLGIFDWIGPSGITPAMHDLALMSPILAANSFGTLISSGDWPIAGNTTPQIKKFPFPAYKVLINKEFYIEDWDNNYRRKATKKEVQILDFRNGVSPIRLEKALKAYHKLLPWHESYDKFKISYLDKQAKLIV